MENSEAQGQANVERRNQSRRNTDRRAATTKDFDDKGFVFREHETGQEAFVVKSGQVEILKTVSENGQTREVSLGVLGQGTMFGEMALIDNKPRMASARAYQGPLSVLVISQSQFNAMLEPVNPFVKKLLEILANHVRASGQTQDGGKN
jgi:CRP/FNR family transcriptional regulator, cyclic AMP receptor protein